MSNLSILRQTITEIQQDAKTLPKEVVLSKLDDMFMEIIQDDKPLFFIKKNESFFSSRADDGDSRRFIRMFTDNTLAQIFSDTIQDSEVYKVSVLDALQVIKLAFLNGDYGIMLNDGDVWAAVSIRNFIDAFMRIVMNEPNSTSDSFINCINLVRLAKQNSTTRLVCRTVEDKPAIQTKDGYQSFIAQESLIGPPSGDTGVCPINAQTLFFLSYPAHIELPGASFIIDAEDDLLAALHIMSVTLEDTVYKPAKDFYDEPEAMDGSRVNYRGISHIALNFTDTDYLYDKAPPPCFSIVVIPTEDDSDDLKSRVILFLKKITVPACLLSLLSMFRNSKREKNKVSSISGDTQENTVLDCHSYDTPISDSDIQHNHDSHINASNDVDDASPQDKESDKSAGIDWACLCKKLPFAIGLALVLFLMFFGISSFGFSTNGTPEDSFLEQMGNQNYYAASDTYQKYDIDSDVVSSAVSDEINNLLSNYGSNKIDGLELIASLDSLSVFQNSTQSIDTAKASALILESSKNSYVLGANEDYIPDKLVHWANVIPADTAHYSAVSTSVTKNPNWCDDMISAIEGNIYTDREIATLYAKTSSFFFPESSDTDYWVARLVGETSTPILTEYPISINALGLTLASNNSLTMTIQWENSSVKSIKSISFGFIFQDENGEIVQNTVRDSVSSVFFGTENSSYGFIPGYKTPSESWGWKNIWTGDANRVATTKLVEVSISYSDGSFDQFSSDSDLKNIMR